MAFGSSQWMYSAGADDYEIPYSCRFNDNDSAYLSRTPGSDGNRTTWTFSCWVKRGNFDTDQRIFGQYQAAGYSTANSIYIGTDNKLQLADWHQTRLYVDRIFRDASAWFHIVIAWDTTQATDTDRVKVYINGEQQTLVEVTAGTATGYPSQNAEDGINSTLEHNIGSLQPYAAVQYYDGYMAEMHFIDGTACDADDFGKSGDYGEWKAKSFSGTYGTNGFYLDFADSGDLGDDESGNGNDWTVNNLSAHDQMLDTPTNNFAVMNAVHRYCASAFREGSLELRDSGTAVGVSSIQPNTGKWYWETDPDGRYSGSPYWGMFSKELKGNLKIGDGGFPNNGTGVTIVSYSGGANFMTAMNEGTMHGTTGPWPHDHVWGFAMDCDEGKLWISRDGDWTHVLASSNPSTATNPCVSGLSSWCVPSFGTIGSTSDTYHAWVRANFGQDGTFAGNQTSGGYSDDNDIGDFMYEPPTGFLALCTANLPDVDVIPSEHFNTVLYTGNNTATAITGAGFQPDLVYIKSRSAAGSSNIYDAVRTVSSGGLISNSTAAEQYTSGQFTSFDSDGFTLPVDGGGYSNVNNRTYAAWCWKANGSGSSNTTGSINSTVSANADAGFSIVGYTGTGSAGTIGHGLSKAPEIVIVKKRSAAAHWAVYTAITTATKWFLLALTSSAQTASTMWNNSEPTSSVFNIGTAGEVSSSGKTFIAYCWHSVDGYSKVGSYTGNGNVDGTFVWTGFRPAFIIAKKVDTAENWVMINNKTHPYNDVNTPRLYPNLANSEYEDASIYVDYLSNGFKIRSTQNMMNTNGSKYLYLAFAETPFKYSNAR